MRILVVGLGQMGGSLAWAAKKAGHYVIGYNRNREVIDYALEKGILNEGLYALTDAGNLKIDIIVIGAALSAYPDIFEQLDKIVKPSWIITDMGSVKEYVMKLASNYESLKHVFFGGHPMAGAEKAGIKNLSEDLFLNRRWYYTEFDAETYGGELSSSEKIKTLNEFIRSIGANAMKIDATIHDEFAARGSHLPQIISVLMAASLNENHPQGEYLEIAGGGFRDVSRLAGSSFDIWNDILLLNRENLIKELGDFSYMLDFFIKILENDDKENANEIFKKSNKTRQLFLEKAEELGINI